MARTATTAAPVVHGPPFVVTHLRTGDSRRLRHLPGVKTGEEPHMPGIEPRPHAQSHWPQHPGEQTDEPQSRQHPTHTHTPSHSYPESYRGPTQGRRRARPATAGPYRPACKGHQGGPPHPGSQIYNEPSNEAAQRLLKPDSTRAATRCDTTRSRKIGTEIAVVEAAPSPCLQRETRGGWPIPPQVDSWWHRPG